MRALAAWGRVSNNIKLLKWPLPRMLTILHYHCIFLYSQDSRRIMACSVCCFSFYFLSLSVSKKYIPSCACCLLKCSSLFSGRIWIKINNAFNAIISVFYPHIWESISTNTICQSILPTTSSPRTSCSYEPGCSMWLRYTWWNWTSESIISTDWRNTHSCGAVCQRAHGSFWNSVYITWSCK